MSQIHITVSEVSEYNGIVTENERSILVNTPGKFSCRAWNDEVGSRYKYDADKLIDKTASHYESHAKSLSEMNGKLNAKDLDYDHMAVQNFIESLRPKGR